MLKRIIEIIGAPIENYFAEHSQDIIKTRDIVMSPDSKKEFKQYAKAKKKRHVDEIKVQAEDGRTLLAHKLVLANAPDSQNKKAIIYLYGSNSFVAEALPNLEPLLADLQNQDETTHLACYSQDYRGRGFNQQRKENFNQYPALQDAKDQVALVRNVIAEGYKPEDILLLGYSYGSVISLWVADILIKEAGPTYARLKVYSDRGYGDLFNFPVLRLFVADSKIAHKKLHEKQMMPEKPLHDIALNLPNAFVFHVEKDKALISQHITLANTFAKEEMPGKVWQGAVKAESKETDPHFAPHSKLKMKFISELEPKHFIAALLNEAPISLKFNFESLATLQNELQGYAMKPNVLVADKEYFPFSLPNLSNSSADEEKNSITVSSNVVAKWISELNDYCVSKAKLAQQYPECGEYNRAWFSKTGLFGWTVRQQITMATQMMSLLYHADGPHIAELKTLKDQKGPHRSGRLQIIFEGIMQFVLEYNQLQEFNRSIRPVSQLSQAQIQPKTVKKGKKTKGLFVENEGWEYIESKEAETPTVKNTI